METINNVLIDKWVVSGSTNFEDETYFQIKNDLKDKNYEAIEYKEKLIQAAVNACKAINPNNPIKVAEVLPELFTCFVKLYGAINLCRPFHITGDTKELVEKIIKDSGEIIQKSLPKKQATE